MSCFSLERATRLELAPRHPTNCLRQFAGALPSSADLICAPRMGVGIEFFSSDEKIRTSNSDVLIYSGAGYEARTRYLHLGKVALYQMS